MLSMGTSPRPPVRKGINTNNTIHIKTINTAERNAVREDIAVRRDVFSSMDIFCLTTSLINGSIYKRIRWSFPVEKYPCAVATHRVL